MTVFTVAAVAIVCTGGAAAGVGAAIGATSGAAAGTTGSAAALAGAVAGSTSAGAIAGAGAGGTVLAAGTGAAAGATAAAGVGGSTLGGTGLVTAGISSGPVGWIVLGTSAKSNGNGTTFDCWKPVLHDVSEQPSNGMLLKDLCAHPNIARVSCEVRSGSDLPDIVIENIWNEKFGIEYLMVHETEQIFGHAKKL
jgi:hypothetical protein